MQAVNSHGTASRPGTIGRVDHLLSDGRQLVRSQRTVVRELRQKTLVLHRVEFIDRTAHASVMD